MLVGPTFNPEEQPNLAQQDWLLRKQQNVRCNSSGWLALRLLPEAAGARVNDASHCQLHFCFRAAETLRT